jgi:hypothetical protein
VKPRRPSFSETVLVIIVIVIVSVSAIARLNKQQGGLNSIGLPHRLLKDTRRRLAPLGL